MNVDISRVLGRISILEDRIRKLKCYVDKQLQNNTGGFTVQRVNTYNDLPDPAAHFDEYYHVLNSQGTKWLPGSLGGTYYSKGFYYSNGAVWLFVGEIPWEATQSEVNAGTVTDLFVTPYTLDNYSKWNDKVKSYLNTLTPYNSDDAALLGGLSVGDWYLSGSAHESLPYGVPKRIQ